MAKVTLQTVDAGETVTGGTTAYTPVPTTAPTPGKPAGVTVWGGTIPVLHGAQTQPGGVGAGGPQFVPSGGDGCGGCGGGISTSPSGAPLDVPASFNGGASLQTAVAEDPMSTKNWLWLAAAFAAGWYVGKNK